MFEQLSVRVVAGMLLWSSAWVFFSVTYYVRILPYAGALSDIKRLELMLMYMIPAAFFGVLWGGLICGFKRPLWLNISAFVGAVLGLQFARRFAPFDFPFPSDPNANGLVMLALFSMVGTLVGFIPRAKGTRLPFKLPRDRAQVALEEIEQLRAKRSARSENSESEPEDKQVH